MSAQFKDRIREYALATLGFDDCGFCAAAPDAMHLEKNRRWLELGYNADMRYLERHMEQRSNPELLLSGARTVIVLVKNYRNTRERKLSGDLKLARYAAGLDYHAVIGEKLETLSAFIRANSPQTDTKCAVGVDNIALNERSYALRAGLGSRGKNCLLITPRFGSYVFLSLVITTCGIEPDPEPESEADICGDCGLCLRACPTGALTADGLNAKKCISFRTIESREPICEADAPDCGGWVWGCDICQEVCPLNNRGSEPICDWPEFMPEAGPGFDFFSGFEPQGEIPRGSSLWRGRGRIRSNMPGFLGAKDKRKGPNDENP